MEFTSLLKGPYDTRLLPAPWASIYRQLRQPCQAIRSGVVRMVRIVMSLSDLPKHGFVFRYDREKHKVEAAFWGPGVIFVLGLVGVIFALWACGLLSPMRLQSFDGRSTSACSTLCAKWFGYKNRRSLWSVHHRAI